MAAAARCSAPGGPRRGDALGFWAALQEEGGMRGRARARLKGEAGPRRAQPIGMAGEIFGRGSRLEVEGRKVGVVTLARGPGLSVAERG